MHKRRPEWIDHALERSAGREIFPVEEEGRRYWIKKGRPTGSHALHHLGYRLTGLPFLHPVQSKDALQAVAYEAGKLKRLESKGVSVPSVVWQEEEFFILEDRGETLAKLLKGASSAEGTAWLQRVAEALAGLHRTGEYHGASQIRNFTMDEEGKVSIIDFEESFPDGADLEALQFRDLFLLLYSLHRQRWEMDYAAFLEHYIQLSGQEAFREKFHELYRRFRWLAKAVESEKVRSLLGSDAEILHRLFESLHQG